MNLILNPTCTAMKGGVLFSPEGIIGGEDGVLLQLRPQRVGARLRFRAARLLRIVRRHVGVPVCRRRPPQRRRRARVLHAAHRHKVPLCKRPVVKGKIVL